MRLIPWVVVLLARSVYAQETPIDLSDDWTPFIFDDMQGADGQPLSNRYRSVYIGLANDHGDPDGQPLAPGEHNYLELYGIPPSLSVLRARFVDDKQRNCSAVDLSKLAAVKSIPPRGDKAEMAVAKLAAQLRALEKERKKARLETLAELAEAQPKLAKAIAEVQKYAAERAAFPEVEKRLICEGMLGEKSKHKRGEWDDPMRDAIIRFQHKHMLYDAAALRPETMSALGRSLLVNDYAALVRVLTEQIVAATGVLEDGSIGEKTYDSASGQKLPVRNMVDEAVKATLAQLSSILRKRRWRSSSSTANSRTTRCR